MLNVGFSTEPEETPLGTPSPLAACMFLKLRSRERGLAAVGADDHVEDRKDDQLHGDVMHDRQKGVQHRISSDEKGIGGYKKTQTFRAGRHPSMV